jgi:hypothetical protein
LRKPCPGWGGHIAIPLYYLYRNFSTITANTALSHTGNAVAAGIITVEKTITGFHALGVNSRSCAFHQSKKTKKKSADEAGNAVETLSLPVSAFHGIGFCKVHPFGNPAFRAVGKRRGFHKFSANPEFPAVDAEPAVFGRLLFLRKALNFSLAYRQDAIIVFGHWQIPVSWLLITCFTRHHIKPENRAG